MGTGTDAHRYGGTFFDYVDASSGRSAEAFLSRLDLGYRPASVLDVGCGRGVWLEAWKRLGAGTVLGLDGDYVDPATVRLGPGEFRAVDLAAPFEVGRRFDLVECLEVAEHLPAASAGALVASLVRHGDVVLFSAAPPGQGGEHHVNEQPIAYWASRFAGHGFAAFDCARPRVRNVQEIEPWYRYNALVFASDAGVERLSEGARATRVTGAISVEQYAPLAWQLRCAILRRTPRPVVEALARARHASRRRG
jgi:SAM-dependent methyltransferase